MVNLDKIDLLLILDNNQKEITRFYNELIPLLSFITKKNEEIANDIFLKILSKLTNFDIKRGKLYNYVYIIALNEYKVTQRTKKKNIQITNFTDLKDEIKKNLYNIKEIEDETYTYEEEFVKLISKLNNKEKEFVIKYINQKEIKKTKDRVFFHKIKQKLKK